MSRHATVLVLLLFAAPAWAGNFATCLLDKLPGTQNGAVHAAVFQTCGQEHPSRYSGVEKGSGRGIFGFSDGNACTLKKAASTSFQPSAGAIAVACQCLYEKPVFKNEYCDGNIRQRPGEPGFDPSTAQPVQ